MKIKPTTVLLAAVGNPMQAAFPGEESPSELTFQRVAAFSLFSLPKTPIENVPAKITHASKCYRLARKLYTGDEIEINEEELELIMERVVELWPHNIAVIGAMMEVFKQST